MGAVQVSAEATESHFVVLRFWALGGGAPESYLDKEVNKCPVRHREDAQNVSQELRDKASCGFFNVSWAVAAHGEGI